MKRNERHDKHTKSIQVIDQSMQDCALGHPRSRSGPAGLVAFGEGVDRCEQHVRVKSTASKIRAICSANTRTKLSTDWSFENGGTRPHRGCTTIMHTVKKMAIGDPRSLAEPRLLWVPVSRPNGSLFRASPTFPDCYESRDHNTGGGTARVLTAGHPPARIASGMGGSNRSRNGRYLVRSSKRAGNRRLGPRLCEALRSLITGLEYPMSRVRRSDSTVCVDFAASVMALESIYGSPRTPNRPGTSAATGVENCTSTDGSALSTLQNSCVNDCGLVVCDRQVLKHRANSKKYRDERTLFLVPGRLRLLRGRICPGRKRRALRTDNQPERVREIKALTRRQTEEPVSGNAAPPKLETSQKRASVSRRTPVGPRVMHRTAQRRVGESVRCWPMKTRQLLNRKMVSERQSLTGETATPTPDQFRLVRCAAMILQSSQLGSSKQGFESYSKEFGRLMHDRTQTQRSVPTRTVEAVNGVPNTLAHTSAFPGIQIRESLGANVAVSSRLRQVRNSDMKANPRSRGFSERLRSPGAACRAGGLRFAALGGARPYLISAVPFVVRPLACWQHSAKSRAVSVGENGRRVRAFEFEPYPFPQPLTNLVQTCLGPRIRPWERLPSARRRIYGCVLITPHVQVCGFRFGDQYTPKPNLYRQAFAGYFRPQRAGLCLLWHEPILSLIAEMSSRTVVGQRDAQRRSRSWADRSEARAGTPEPSERAEHPLRNLPTPPAPGRVPCAGSTLGSGARVPWIRAHLLNNLPSIRAADEYRP